MNYISSLIIFEKDGFRLKIISSPLLLKDYRISCQYVEYYDVMTRLKKKRLPQFSEPKHVLSCIFIFPAQTPLNLHLNHNKIVPL